MATMKSHSFLLGRIWVFLAAAAASGGCLVTFESDPAPENDAGK